MISVGGVGLLAGTSVLNAAQQEVLRGHIVLLGDSIFDNGVYVDKGPAVIDQVREELGDKWKATLLAVDGDVTADVQKQLERLPSSVTHIILSVGGNDALGSQHLLSESVRTCAEAFMLLGRAQERFEKQYSQMLKLVLSHRKPTAVCTIYDPNFGDDTTQRVSITALSLFNDRITRLAFSYGIPVIDLRLLFCEKADYANPIEPSSKKGKKIATEIRRIVTTHDFSERQSAIYCGGLAAALPTQ